MRGEQTMAESQENRYAQLVARAWRDAAFKARLMANPKAVLHEMGLAVPAGVEVEVVENTAQKITLVLPAAPSGELSEEELDRVAGGWACLICW